MAAQRKKLPTSSVVFVLNDLCLHFESVKKIKQYCYFICLHFQYVEFSVKLVQKFVYTSRCHVVSRDNYADWA